MKMHTIVGGVDGVGKSSFLGVLQCCANDLGTIVDVDKITAQLGGDALAGGKAAIRILDDCLEKGVSFTQETTLSGRRTESTARKAREQGYNIRLYYIGLDTAAESLARIENRVRRGGHDIAQENVLRRFSERFKVVAKVLALLRRSGVL